MPKPNESGALRAEPDLPAVEPGMDDILRSIRGILGEEEVRKVEFPEGSDNDPGPDLPPRREPPLAFLQRKRAPEVMEPVEAGTPPTPRVGEVAPSTGVPSLEERLARHREKAAAERKALRELAERAEARVRTREVATETPTTGSERGVSSEEPVPVAFASSPAEPIGDQDLFDVPSDPAPARRMRRMPLPEIAAEPVDYARPAPPVEVLAPEPDVTAGLDETFEDIARSLLKESAGEMDGMLADMMRPLVREWLDDNLAAIVERVVREEIERVSRGMR